jgi:hypothetical protein
MPLPMKLKDHGLEPWRPLQLRDGFSGRGIGPLPPWWRQLYLCVSPSASLPSRPT